MEIHGIRGAITVESNTREEILTATQELLVAILENNPSLKIEDLASVFFTCTQDLTAVYPARAARDMGWLDLPMLCAQEMNVEGSISKCIRVLLHWNTSISLEKIQHVYLRDAIRLRPDWANKNKKNGVLGGDL
ncbi:MAG: chorismate mutase [Anaerolineaceae bacterium]